MSTETQEVPKTLKNQNDLKGNWVLTYKLVNSEGERAFAGKTISSYTDPMTGKARHLFNADGQFLPGFLIDKTRMVFKPSVNPYQVNILDWLIGHPDVGVEKDHVKMDERYFLKKNTNPRIMLVNLDHQSTVELDDEDFIDKLVGRLSLDTGQQAVSLKKLRYVLSALNRPYMNPKLINDKNKEKLFLRKALKDFARSGTSTTNAESVNVILDDLDHAKFLYEIKEMVRYNILYQSGGMYKYNGAPLGISIESVIKYFINNIEVYTEMSGQLAERLKEEFGY
jgi:hypothetical protein